MQYVSNDYFFLLKGFEKNNKLQNHENNCFFNKPTRVKMPSDNEIIKFNNFHHMIEYRFVIYAGNYMIVEKT